MDALHIHIFEASGTLSLEPTVSGFLVIDNDDEFKGNRISILVDAQHRAAIDRAIVAFNRAWSGHQSAEAVAQ